MAAFLDHVRAEDCAVSPPKGIVPPEPDRSTLFVTATIQVWREWALAPVSVAPARRGGLQWCVRMRGLERVGDERVLTAFLMAGEATAGPVDRAEVFARVHRLLGDRLGLPTGRLVYVLNGARDRQEADTASAHALAEIGVPAERTVVRPRPWARPFHAGPTGPSVFVLLDTGRSCGGDCGPGCTCGRYLQVWHLVFLERDLDGRGVLAARGRVVVDGAASIEWLDAAAGGTFDVYQTVLIRDLFQQLGAWVPARRGARILADHCRTIALLTGSGIRPGARGHGQVLRRLISRACATTDACLADRERVLAGAVAASACYAGLAGFPALTPDGRRALGAELVAYERRVAAARRRYRRRIGRCRSERSAAQLVFELKTSGAPLEVVADWLAADGVPFPQRELERLRSAERMRSRPRA